MANAVTILSHSPNESADLARSIAPRLGAGNVILLEGHIGGGKTHFARSIIQETLATNEDVPSPTFTLVQTYNAEALEIWHADLYRLSHPDEVFELGLVDAFEDSLCLIEWPDRLGDLAPESALTLTFSASNTLEEREISAAWTDPKWDFIRDLWNV